MILNFNLELEVAVVVDFLLHFCFAGSPVLQMLVRGIDAAVVGAMRPQKPALYPADRVVMMMIR